MEKQILFTEAQRFRKWWFWLILILATAPIAGILIYQLKTGQSVGTSPASNSLLFAILVFLFAPLFVVFYFIKLFTIIDIDTISYGFGFAGKKLKEIRLADVKEMEVIPYKFLSIGLHLSYKYGMVYNTSWGTGLFITKSDNSKVLIGTQKPDELKAAIAKMSKRV